jgi:ABC-type nitrate/sulfonate/bicarbonate transport system substrate-binding protein
MHGDGRATLRSGPVPEDAVTGLVLNLNGNAITLSEELWKAGVRDANTLARHLRGLRNHVPTFGIVSTQSSHGYLLRKWLLRGGINPESCRFVVVPPPQMAGHLRAGHLDGYCAGEPWNTEAVAAGVGWIAATSSSLEPLHPEKVLTARASFCQRHHEEHLAIIASLVEACRWCDDPANHPEIAALLAADADIHIIAAFHHLAAGLGEARLVTVQCRNGEEAGQVEAQAEQHQRQARRALQHGLGAGEEGLVQHRSGQ